MTLSVQVLSSGMHLYAHKLEALMGMSIAVKTLTSSQCKCEVLVSGTNFLNITAAFSAALTLSCSRFFHPDCTSPRHSVMLADHSLCCLLSL